MGGWEQSILVLGGGPVGAYAAYSLARDGWNVSLLAGPRRSSAVEASSLHPGIEPLFVRQGLMEGFLGLQPLRFEGIREVTNGQTRFRSFGEDSGGPWRGFHIARIPFEFWLLREAMRAGVRVFWNAPAMELIGSTPGRISVRSRFGIHRSGSLIDATGRRRWVAGERVLHVDQSYKGIVIHGVVHRTPGECDNRPVLSRDAAGWQWCAPMSENRAIWLHQRFDGKLPHCESWSPELIVPPRATTASAQSVDPPCAEGFWLVGDAAHALPPISGKGLINGFAMADKLTTCLGTWRACRFSSGALEGACMAYSRFVTSLRESDHAMLNAWYKRSS